MSISPIRPPVSRNQSTPGNPNDPWTLSGAGYSPDSFFTRATDGNGHDTTIHVKVSPALMAQITEVRESKDIPDYRTIADIVRDSVIHRLNYLSSNGFTGAVDMGQLELEQKQAMLDKARDQRARWKMYLDDLDECVGAAIDSRDLDEAKYLLEESEVFEGVMSPSALGRLKEIMRRHGREIKRVEKEG